MMKTARALFASLLVLSAGALISGCQSDPDIDITKLGLETDPPDVLYTQGLANMKAGNMAEAGASSTRSTARTRSPNGRARRL